MPSLPLHLKDKLKKRSSEGSLRKLVDLSDSIDFFSNDYLGLARQSFPAGQYKQGSTGSRLISGNSKFAEQVEAELAAFYGYNAGLIFNSGFDANLGIYSCIPQRGDTVIFDELCHASIRDGLRLNFAEKKAFRHNDINHLEEILKSTDGQVYVAVESLYSMDGDVSPLKAIINICKQYNTLVILDEAHSGGVYGEHGKGLSEELGCDDGIFIKLITFGKAYGSHGAIALCDEEVRQYLLNYARSFIYTTALPDVAILRIQQTVEFSAKVTSNRTRLLENIAFFNREIKKAIPGFKVNFGPVQVFKCSDTDLLNAKAEAAVENNLAVKVIMSPTVPKGEERIRICLHAFNTEQEIISLIKVLS